MNLSELERDRFDQSLEAQERHSRERHTSRPQQVSA